MEEWRARVRQLIGGDAWIIDGNYGGTLELRLEACDTVVFLDVPRAVCLRRVLGRQLRSLGRVRSELAPGCRERLSWEYLTWIWTYGSRRRRDVLTRLAALRDGQQAIILASSAAIETFLVSVPRAAA